MPTNLLSPTGLDLNLNFNGIYNLQSPAIPNIPTIPTIPTGPLGGFPIPPGFGS